MVGISLGLSLFLSQPLAWLAGLAALLITVLTLGSLLVSFYVYDLSGFYDLGWLDDEEGSVILNVSAGFDETSGILRSKYCHGTHHVMDFYHSLQKKEVSIQRAKRAYPLLNDTLEIDLGSIPLSDESVDRVFAIFAAHEIREESDRVGFFKELNRVTQTQGKVYVVEHMRDALNFMAYNIGFFHFLPRADWLRTFEKSGWCLRKTIKHTPFVSVFVLEKEHGIAS